MFKEGYDTERAQKTLTMGRHLSLYGLLFIGIIMFLEVSVYNSVDLMLCRLFFIIPAVIFLFFSYTLFRHNLKLIIPFHTFTVSGGVAMMVGIAIVKYQMVDMPPAFRIATVSGGLVTAIFIMFIFSEGARKNFSYVISALLILSLFNFFFNENLTWLEVSPFVNPLISAFGVIIMTIIMERLQYQEYKMRKKLESTNERLKEEIKQKAELEEKLREQAIKDDLTGVFNRRASYKLINKCLNYSQNNKENFVVCYIDLDNLKLINDSYGHGEGDKLIITFTKIIKKVIRENDYICRVGGDEFLINN